MNAVLHPGSTPEELVAGNPDELEALAVRLGGFAGELRSTGAALSRIDAGAWSGSGAQSFATTLREETARYDNAAGGAERAAGGLRQYASALRAARSSARYAIVLNDEAEAATRIWQHQSVLAGGVPLGTDPGAPGRARAAYVLSEAHAELATAAAAMRTQLGELAHSAIGATAPLAHLGSGAAAGAPVDHLEVELALGLWSGAGVAALAAAAHAMQQRPKVVSIDPDGWTPTARRADPVVDLTRRTTVAFASASGAVRDWAQLEDPTLTIGGAAAC